MRLVDDVGFGGGAHAELDELRNCTSLHFKHFKLSKRELKGWSIKDSKDSGIIR